MKKIFLNETEKQKIIANREKAIMESFAKTYNKIKRVDENEIQANPDMEFLKWEEMWEDSPKDMKAVMYFSKNMPENIWKKFLDKYSTDIKIAQAEFKSFKKKYGRSSMFENDGLDMGELGRQERSVQYGIDPYQEQPDLTPQEGDTYTNVNVLTQDGTYEKRNVTVVSVYPENREALVRTDAGGDAVVSFDDLNQMGETFNKIKRVDENEVSPTANPEAIADKAIAKVKNDPHVLKAAQQIAKDPKAMAELQKLLAKLNIKLNENIGIDPKQITLAFMDKVDSLTEENVGPGFFLGLFGGGTLAHYLYSVPVFDGVMTHYSAAMGPTIAGAIIGAVIGVIASAILTRD